MNGILGEIWDSLTRTRELRLRGLLKAVRPVADLAVTFIGLGVLLSEASLATGPVLLSVVVALGIRRAVVRRRAREGGALERGDADRHLLGEESGLWDCMAAGIYGLMPFLGFPTAAHLWGQGLVTEALLYLIPSAAALLPPGLLTAEGTVRLLERKKRISGTPSAPELELEGVPFDGDSG